MNEYQFNTQLERLLVTFYSKKAAEIISYFTNLKR